MKLESLKSSKFEAFKEDEISNIFSIIGGRCYNSANNGNEHYTTGTKNKDANGNYSQVLEDGVLVDVDWSPGRCPGLVMPPTTTNTLNHYLDDPNNPFATEQVLECQQC